ncbi:bacterio-opsin activator domain-containing protein [Natrarchaeobius chitinivorans]|uniref:Bacterio-opsin activator n=1 Tax=Natrarchaeobius chitinivorans TaxID=1679083 RepID=A0A3N6M331_NATCH|nr:bacterio-opsin activator domain-containing protein [Natrarchaeobius chitinivorans]RQG97868.1 bacterio-opsin activator [Natrarchaeobius chitinivorans]
MGHEPGSESTVVEVEFEISHPQYLLVELTETTGCTAELVQILPRSHGAYTVFHRVTGTTPESVLEVVEEYDEIDVRVVSSSDDEVIVEFQIGEDGEFFTTSLTDAGAIPTELSSRDGTVRIVAEIPSIHSASDVIAQFQEAYPPVEIVARRQKEYSVPLFHQQELYESVIDLLTPRQHEALLLAYMNGFYEWPRETTGEQLADEMDVTPPTFYEHLRSAERKLLSVIFTK